MKLRVLNGPQQGHLFELAKPRFTIGRDAENDLVLTDGVSRRHCAIAVEGGVLVIEDLHSTNGVRVNGQKITDLRPLKAGDHVGIGNYVLLVMTGDEVTEPVASVAPGETPDAAAGGSATWVKALVVVLLLALAGAGGWWFAWGPGARQLAPAAVTPAPASGPVATPPVAPEASPVPAVIPETPPPPAAPAAADAVPAGTIAPADDQAPPLMAVVASEPVGATVSVDGEPRGVTPAFLRNLTPGRHTITLTLPGYEELTRQIQAPLALPDRPYELRQLPGTVRITSDPIGASVRFGARVLGQTPLLLAPGQLPPFVCELRIAADGYEPVKVKAQASESRPEQVNVILKSKLGSLSVTSVPDGCDVFVGDTFMGRTAAGDEVSRQSQPLVISGLPEGDYELKVVHPLGGAGAREKHTVQITRGRTKAETVRLWVRDTEVLLTDGTKHYGMRVEVNTYGDIVLAISPKKQERFLKPQIQRIAPVTPEMARRLPPPPSDAVAP
jgi:hypothetical protein